MTRRYTRPGASAIVTHGVISIQFAVSFGFAVRKVRSGLDPAWCYGGKRCRSYGALHCPLFAHAVSWLGAGIKPARRGKWRRSASDTAPLVRSRCRRPLPARAQPSRHPCRRDRSARPGRRQCRRRWAGRGCRPSYRWEAAPRATRPDCHVSNGLQRNRTNSRSSHRPGSTRVDPGRSVLCAAARQAEAPRDGASELLRPLRSAPDTRWCGSCRVGVQEAAQCGRLEDCVMAGLDQKIDVGTVDR